MRFFLLALMLLGSGCISIKTYEEKIKACRDLTVRAEEMEEDLAYLRVKSQEFKSVARSSEMERQQLKKEIEAQSEYIYSIRGTYDQLINELKEDIGKGNIRVRSEGGELTIVMEEKVLFPSGSAQLQKSGQGVIHRIAEILKTVKDHYIRVDGHSDNIPITGKLQQVYPTNWELSAARAANVVRHLEQNAGIHRENLFLSAFSKNRPVESNESEKGREQNRRVEITLIPIPL